jgi:hypothetical protein
MRLFKREDYLEKVRGFYHDDGIVKVLPDGRSTCSARDRFHRVCAFSYS